MNKAGWEIPGLRQQRTLNEETYVAILAAICEGTVAPETRVNQDELAQKLGVSRQPVAQALSLLRAQGFLRDTGRRGLIVAPIEREFFQAAYEIRSGLDPLAAELAAQRASKSQIGTIREALESGLDIIDSASVKDLIEADMRFHMCIYEASGNPLIVQTMELYWNHLRRAMAPVLRQQEERKIVWQQHRSIFRTIESANVALARSAALEHVQGASERVLARMERPLPESIPQQPESLRSA